MLEKRERKKEKIKNGNERKGVAWSVEEGSHR